MGGMDGWEGERLSLPPFLPSLSFPTSFPPALLPSLGCEQKEGKIGQVSGGPKTHVVRMISYSQVSSHSTSQRMSNRSFCDPSTERRNPQTSMALISNQLTSPSLPPSLSPSFLPPPFLPPSYPSRSEHGGQDTTLRALSPNSLTYMGKGQIKRFN